MSLFLTVSTASGKLTPTSWGNNSISNKNITFSFNNERGLQPPQNWFTRWLLKPSIRGDEKPSSRIIEPISMDGKLFAFTNKSFSSLHRKAQFFSKKTALTNFANRFSAPPFVIKSHASSSSKAHTIIPADTTDPLVAQGPAGYNLIVSPTKQSFRSFLGTAWVQGIPGSAAPAAAPSVFEWQASAAQLRPVSSLDAAMEPGRAYAIYLFADDDPITPGVQGGFPKSFKATESRAFSAVAISLEEAPNKNGKSANNSARYYLLSNPFDVAVGVGALTAAIEEDKAQSQRTVAVWQPTAGNGNGAFAIKTFADTLSAYQPFFVQVHKSNAAPVELHKSRLAVKWGTPSSVNPNRVDLRLRLSGDQKYDELRFLFSENGMLGKDRYDGPKLFSLKDSALSTYSRAGEQLVALNALPKLTEIQSVRIPVGLHVPVAGSYSFSWQHSRSLSPGYNFTLVDTQTGRSVDLRTAESYSFRARARSTADNTRALDERFPNPTRPGRATAAIDDRFELRIEKRTSMAEEAAEDEEDAPVALTPNYPNPFLEQTTMELRLKKPMHVKMEVFNIVGQKVATMADEMMTPNQTHIMTWNVPPNIPSGIYICKIEAGNTTMTRKMTLVK